jgi:CAAX protease family protein
MQVRLRAVGRLLAFALLAFVVFPAVKRGLRSALHGTDGTVVYLVDHLFELAAVLMFCTIAAGLERRPFGAFGMPWRDALRARFWQGAGAGLVSLAVLVLALQGAGALQVGASATPPLRAAGFFVVYAAIFALLAMREEFLYRGYGLFTLTAATAFWPAAVASTVWFAWTHAGNANESPIGLANVAIFGLLACFTLRRTGSLWMAIGFHATWDWGQTYLFGVGDSGHPPAPGHLLTSLVPGTAPAWLSGGAVGPEGSLLCTGLLAALWIACARLLHGVRYPSTPLAPGALPEPLAPR